MKNLLIRFILPAVLLCQVMVGQEGAHTIFLVRHAEKASSAPDALLSPAGQQRAACLARELKDAGIGQIYVTDLKRTQQTAEPLAKALGLKPTILATIDRAALMKGLLYATKNVLVVGHSDTLPVVIQQLHAGTITPIAENEYDRLLVVTVIAGGGTGPVATLRYCAGQPQAPAAKTTPKPARPQTKKK